MPPLRETPKQQQKPPPPTTPQRVISTEAKRSGEIHSRTQSSVDFSKKKAKEHHTSDQKMIRRLIDRYATQHQRSV